MTPRSSRLADVLHGLALALAAAAMLYEVSLPAGILGAVVGTGAAVVLAGTVARSSLRLGLVWLIAVGGVSLGMAGGQVLVQGTLIVDWLGPRSAMSAADALRFTLAATALTLAMRTTTMRWRPFAFVELAVVAFALAGLVSAHRDGAINHPRMLSDWAWSTGRDPARLLLWFGVATSLALIVALLREERGRGGRIVLHLGLAGALVALVLLAIGAYSRLLQPPRGGLGSSSGKGGRPGERGQGSASRGGQRKNQLDQLEFKDDYSSPSDDVPVAVVVLHDDYSPPLGYYYFRQTAFSQYNGRRLVARTRDDVDRDILRDFPSAPIDVEDAPKPSAERVQISSTVALLTDHIHPFGLETPLAFAPRESPDPTRFVRAYEVTSAALRTPYENLLGRHSFTSAWSDELRRAYTELPPDPRYRSLANEIIAKLLRPEFRSDPFAQAIAISTWLSQQSIYSRRSQHAGADDPTADFLFGDRTGYCVHFAHAAAYLLRARGLPARIAAGYIADEGRKGSGSTILLRQKDAHAWAELYLAGFGWIIVDVAPERTLDPPDTPPDRELQRLLGEMARGKPPKLPENAAIRPPWPSLRQLLQPVALALLAVVILGYLVKLWRGLVPLLVGVPTVYRVAYRAALDRLAEVGWRRRPGETRERFALRIATTLAAPSFVTATEQHVAAAYGSQRLVDAAAMRRLAQTARGQVWHQARLWRIFLGLLNPFSWIFTR